MKKVIQVVDEQGEVITSFDLSENGKAVGITREGYQVFIDGAPLKNEIPSKPTITKNESIYFS